MIAFVLVFITAIESNLGPLVPGWTTAASGYLDTKSVQPAEGAPIRKLEGGNEVCASKEAGGFPAQKVRSSVRIF